jgi:hypothetical protein
MLLDPLFDRFVAGSPLSVMARATLEHTLPAHALDDLFERTAERQYTRELLFSSLVDLMSLVVCGTQPHVQAAFHAQVDRLPVTLKAVYDKLQRIEPRVSAELVRFVAQRCEPLIRQLRGTCRDWLPGYRVKVVDGNHLAATQHRLKETRGRAAAPLPGLSLVVLDPALMLAIDVLPCEDGHAQERSLLPALLTQVSRRDVWIADRNFCTAAFLSGIAERGGYFLIRHHANLALEAAADWGEEQPGETGGVAERAVRVLQDGREVLAARCIRVRLAQPTRTGEAELLVLTNLPVADADAVQVAELYRRRWTVETMFQELTCHLGCEVNTLCYPKAALFAFCVALVAYSVLAVVKAALRAEHGEETVREEVSGYYVALELAGMYQGMMVAIPPESWAGFAELERGEMVAVLRQLAGKVDLRRYRKHPRKPKKVPPKRVADKNQPHIATARLLEQRRKSKPNTV